MFKWELCRYIVLSNFLVINLFFYILTLQWLRSKNKSALYEALEKIKSELMLLGFISLLLTVMKGTISEICIPKALGHSWLPCDRESEEEAEKDYDDDNDGYKRLLSFTNLTRSSHGRSLAAAASVDKCAGKFDRVMRTFAWQSSVFIRGWYTSAALIHLCFSCFSRAILYNYTGFRQS